MEIKRCVIIAVAILMLVIRSVYAAEDEAPSQMVTSLVATPIASPQPVRATDGNVHLVYELLLLNVSSSLMKLKQLEILDASENGVVDRLGGTVLESANPPFPGQVPLTLEPFHWTRLLLDVTFAKDAALPKALEHRFQIMLTPAVGNPPVTSATLVSGRTEVKNAPPVVLGPPLEGPRWVVGIGCCFPPSSHRMATLPINGNIFASERFDIDFVQLNPENRLYKGPINQLSSYAYEGAKVLAVADGIVVSLQEGQPEQKPGGGLPSGLTLLQGLGNFLVIDIGNGRFAFYAHLQPKTLKVKVGDKVHSGQLLALLGNSGNSDAPHLHFGIHDGPEPYSSNSLPFVFASFTTIGTVTNSFEKEVKIAGKPAEVGPDRAGPHQNELPLENDVITFSNP